MPNSALPRAESGHPFRTTPRAWLSPEEGFHPSAACLFGSARTRLFAGQRYLHKSAMQSLFAFCESMARIYTTACTYVRKYPAYAGPPPVPFPPAHAPQDARHDPESVPKRARVSCMYVRSYVARTRVSWTQFFIVVYSWQISGSPRNFFPFFFATMKTRRYGGAFETRSLAFANFMRDVIPFLRVPSRNGNVDV